MLLMKKLLIREINEISVPKLFWKFWDAILHTWEVETIKYIKRYLYFHNHTIKEKTKYYNLTAEYNNSKK